MRRLYVMGALQEIEDLGAAGLHRESTEAGIASGVMERVETRKPTGYNVTRQTKLVSDPMVREIAKAMNKRREKGRL